MITADDQTYELTNGLMYLLTCDRVNNEKNLYTKDDLDAYRDIMLRTNAAKKSNDAWKHLTQRSEKFQFIKSLIGENRSSTPIRQQQLQVPSPTKNVYHTPLSSPSQTKQGSGLRKKMKISINKRECKKLNKNPVLNRYMRPINDRYQIVYYDNINELVDRLKILYGEQSAGNTSIQVSNEIQAILEEFKERGIY